MTKESINTFLFIIVRVRYEFDELVAQLEERWPSKPKVVGSNPTKLASSFSDQQFTKLKSIRKIIEAHLLEMIETKQSRIGMRWGGAAGDGLQSTGLLLQKYFNRLGYHVQGFPGTQSTIRGGHVWQHVEIAEDRIESFDRPLDILVCLNKQTLQIHGRDMKEAGVVIYNGESITDEERNHFPDSCTLILAPLTKMAREVNLQTPVLANTVAVGIVLKLVSLDVIAYEAVLRRRFGRREEIINMNLEALKKGYEFYQTPELGLKDPKTPSEERLVISGNEMIALGAAASGLKFLAQYPITPASSILTYLANRSKKLGIVVRQAEDELAAINMIIGAAYAGARAMTASSGPGLSLMAESFG